MSEQAASEVRRSQDSRLGTKMTDRESKNLRNSVLGDQRSRANLSIAEFSNEGDDELRITRTKDTNYFQLQHLLPGR